MPCVKSHYINPKNVFTPKPPNPSPMWGVACHGLGWHSGPCPILTLPWFDLESNGLGDMPHEFELITCQKLPIHTILAKYEIYAQYLSYHLSEGSKHAWNRSLVFIKDGDQMSMPMYIPTLPSKLLQIWAPRTAQVSP